MFRVPLLKKNKPVDQTPFSQLCPTAKPPVTVLALKQAVLLDTAASLVTFPAWHLAALRGLMLGLCM